jgi:Beta-lactamase enzyme family
VIPIALLVDAPPVPVAVMVAAPRRPVITSPAPREISFGRITGQVFAGTARVNVVVGGRIRAWKRITGPARFSFAVNLPPRMISVRVVAVNANGDRSSRTVPNVRGLPLPGEPGVLRPTTEDAVLARRLRTLAQNFPGIAAVYVQDLQTGHGAAWNARARFPAASTLKLPIAIEVLRKLNYRPAAGSSLDRLLRSMLVYSSNEAANSLLVWLGGSTSSGAYRVNALMRSVNVRDSLMYGGYQMATAAARPIPLRVNEQPAFGGGKYTTAWDLAKLHRFVGMAARGIGPLPRVSGTFGRKDARYLLWILSQVADHGKLDRFLSPKATVPHKAGWIGTARHDAGVVYWQSGSFTVAVMTWNANGVGSSSDILAGRVARIARDHFFQWRRTHANSSSAAGLT